MNVNINIKNIFKFLKKEDPNIIDSWDKMPVGLLKDVHRITSDENLSEDDKSLQAAAILARMPYDTLLNLPLDEAQELVARTAFLYEKPEKKKIRKTYTLNGRTYIPLMSMEDMTTAQFIDFNSLINDLDERLPEILSIFLVPKGHKYNDGYDKNTVVKDITERLMVTEALGMASFFINGYKKYVMRTLLYSEAALEVTMWKAPKELRPQAKEVMKALRRLREEIRSSYGCLL